MAAVRRAHEGAPAGRRAAGRTSGPRDRSRRPGRRPGRPRRWCTSSAYPPNGSTRSPARSPRNSARSSSSIHGEGCCSPTRAPRGGSRSRRPSRRGRTRRADGSACPRQPARRAAGAWRDRYRCAVERWLRPAPAAHEIGDGHGSDRVDEGDGECPAQLRPSNLTGRTSGEIGEGSDFEHTLEHTPGDDQPTTPGTELVPLLAGHVHSVPVVLPLGNRPRPGQTPFCISTHRSISR